MPRRREVTKREVMPDPLYNSSLVTKFIIGDEGRQAEHGASGSCTSASR